MTNVEFAQFLNARGARSAAGENYLDPDDPLASLRVTLRRHYDRRAVARGHRAVGCRCATSEDLGGR